MKRKILITGVVSSFIAIVALIVWAAETKTWLFDTAGDYTLSDATKITVAGGVAKLVSSSATINNDTIAEYNTGVYSNTASGPDADLVLSIETGTNYYTSGTFTSRVIDGGVGNTWQTIKASVTNAAADGMGTEISTGESGLVALYHMNGTVGAIANGATVSDALNTNNGTAYNANATGMAYATGKINQAISFDGTDDYVSIPIEVKTALSQFSIELWVKTKEGRTSGTYWQRPTIIGSASAGENSGDLGITSNGGYVGMWNGLGSEGGVLSGVLINDNTWHHIALTRESSALKLYVDGTYQVSQSVGATALDNLPWFIGESNASGGCFPHQGIFDELAIYNRALTASEIASHFANGLGAKFQVRSDTSSPIPAETSFVGPDGTTGSYYFGADSALVTDTNGTVSFDTSHRYAQYKAYLASGSSQQQTPHVVSVTLTNSGGSQFDSTLGDFNLGTFSNTTTLPATTGGSFVGLTKMANGGYNAYGTYTSHVFDTESGVTWNSIAWNPAGLGVELVSNESGPVGLWHFNNNWNDSTANGNTLTAVNGATFSTESVFGSHAASFDGSNDGVTVEDPGSSVLDIPGSITIALWLKADTATGGYETLVAKRYSTVQYQIYLNPYSPSYPSRLLSWYNGTQYVGTWTPTLGVWYHVAAVCDDTKVDFYINGVFHDSVAGATTGDNNDNPLNIGSPYATGGETFHGLLDEVAIWNRALSASEIRDLYQKCSIYRNCPADGGTISFQVRANDNSSTLLTSNFVGPNGSSTTTFAETAGGTSLTGVSGQYFQYRAYLNKLSSNANTTPAFNSVSVTHNTSTTDIDDTRAEFDSGTYSSNTQWHADEVKLTGSPYYYASSPYTFTSSGTLVLDAPIAADVLVVAGGGGGGGTSADGVAGGGGGGAGGMLVGTMTLAAGSYPVTVGVGGNGGAKGTYGAKGSNSVFNGATAIGGGAGRDADDGTTTASDGGSAGGASGSGGGVAGTAQQGNSGGLTGYGNAGGTKNDSNAGSYAGGGGGGAGSAASGRTPGAGRASSISGSSVTYAAGGYGQGTSNDQSAGVAGAANTGNGGNGAPKDAAHGGADMPGGAGGSGIVIIRPITLTFTSGAIDAGSSVTWSNLSWGEDAMGYAEALSASAPTPAAVDTATPGLVGLWSFDSNWTDSEGGNTAIPDEGDAAFDTTTKKVGAGAVVLDGGASGTADYVKIPNSAAIKPTSTMTLEAWVYPHTWPGDYAKIISLDYRGGGAESGTWNSPYISYAFERDGNTDNFATEWTTSGTIYHLGSGLPMLFNRWSHVVATFDGTTVRTYVNGVAGSTASQNGNLDYGTSGDLGIGTRSPYTNLAAESWDGQIDEVAIYNRALTASEIKQHYMDQVGNYGLVGLWHFENAWTKDTVGSDLTNSDAAFDSTNYKLGSYSAVFDVTGDKVYTASAFPALPQFSIEGWVKFATASQATGNGYVFDILTDDPSVVRDTSNKIVVYRDGTAGITSNATVDNTDWHHLAITADGANLKLYIDDSFDKQVAWTGSSSAAALYLGDNNGTDYFTGNIDEVAVYSRALSAGEILDHYRRGVANLKMQVSIDNGATWKDAGGTAGQFITQSPATLNLGGNSQTIKYKATLSTDDSTLTPKLQGVTAGYSSYPTNDPYVIPVDLQAQAFDGYLTGFTQDPAGGTAIEYQVSVDNGANWKWYNTANSTWEAATLGYPTHTNTAVEVNSNIESLYEQLVPGVGGTFKFKAFLHSDGAQAVELDTVTLNYSAGRITITAPNGADSGWYVGTNKAITWTAAGTVGNTWNVYYSKDSGVNYTLITTVEPATVSAVEGTYTYTWTSIPADAASTQVRVKVVSATDTTVKDTSNADFTIENPATYLKVTSTTSSLSAGGSLTATVTAYNVANNVVTSYTGDKTLTFSGATASSNPATSPTASNKVPADVAFGTGTVVTFANGQGTTTLKLYNKENPLISVTDSSISSSQAAYKLQLTVNAAAATKLLWGTQPASSVTAGAPWDAFTVEIADQYGNRRTDATDDVTIASTPAGITGTLTQTAVDGLATFSGIGYTSATTVTVNATASGLTETGASGNVTINPDTASTFALSTPADITAGARAEYTVARYDANNNLVTSGAQTVYLTSNGTATEKFYDAASAGTIITSVAIDNGQSQASFWFYGQTSGSYNITVSDATPANGAIGIADVSDGIVVSPAAAANFTLTSPADITAGTRAAYTVTRKDQYNNLVTSGVQTVSLASNGTAAEKFYDAATVGNIVTSISIGNGDSTANFWFYGEVAASYTITASATGITSATDGITVSPTATTTSFTLNDPADITAGGSRAAYTVTRRDQYNNAVTSGTQAVSLASNGTAAEKFYDAATVGNIITSVSIANGDSTASFWFYGEVAASYTITASATGITSATNGITISPAATASFTINTPADITAGTRAAYTVTRKDQYNNIVTSGVQAVNLTSNGTAAEKFYDAASAGNIITSISIANGASTANFWFYGEVAANYTITASATGITSATDGIVVSPAVAASFTLTAPADITAGTRAAYTVTRKDQYNNLVTSGAQTVSLASNGTAAEKFYDAASAGNIITSISIANGDSTANFWFYGEVAANYTITASATGITSATDGITVSPTATTTSFTLNEPADITAGTRAAYTVTRRDQYNNAVTSGTQAVSLASNGTAAEKFYDAATVGNIITSVSIANGDSTASFWFYGEVAASYTITASATGITSATNGITISPAATASFTLTAPADITAGTRAAYTVTRKDQYDNPRTSGIEAVYLYSSSDGASKAFHNVAEGGSAVATIAFANGFSTANFWYYDEKAGTFTITASDNASAPDGTGITDATDSIIVAPASTAAFFLNAPTDIISSGNRAAYTVTRRDTYSNLVTSGAQAVSLSTSGTATEKFYDAATVGNIVTSVSINNGDSTVNFWYYGVTTGSYTVTTSATGITSATDNITVLSAPTVTITSPNGAEEWKMGTAHNITWTASVGVSSNLGLYYSSDNGANWTTIATGDISSPYPWTVPNTETTTYKIKLTDLTEPTVTDQSNATFSVVTSTITVTSPASGNVWTVGSGRTISWSSEGTVNTNSLTIQYSTNNGASWTNISTGEANDGSYSWASVPSVTPSTTCLVRVFDAQHAATTDNSDAFTIGASFAVTAPNGGAEPWFALKSHNITWNTVTGTAANVKLEYSTNSGSTWTTITSSVTNNGTYAWTLPDTHMDSATALVRVSDALVAATNDVSDAGFKIDYYDITWEVKQGVTHLDLLSVVDSSGWGASSQTSPVTHSYPYGTYQTTWARVGYGDNTTRSWTTSADETKAVSLTAATGEPEYRVMANFAYIAATDTFKINAWLEHGGILMTAPTNNTIKIYNSAGTQLDANGESAGSNLYSATPDANGVFWHTWATSGLAQDQVYFARVDLTYSGVTYSSGMTYSVNIPKKLETIGGGSSDTQTILDAIQNVQDSVGSGLAAKVDGLVTDVNTIESSVGTISTNVTNLQNSLNTVVTNVTAILEDTGVTLPAQIDTKTTEIKDKITDELAKGTRAQILTRSTTLAPGDTITIRYRTTTGLANTTKINVYNDGNAQKVTNGPMTEIGETGVYEYDLAIPTIANDPTWGTGDYTVVCSETTKDSTDSMILSVATNALAAVASNVTALQTSVSNVGLDVDAILAKWGNETATQMSTNINTLLTQIGTGNIAAIKTKTDTIAWGDVTGLVTSAGAIQAKTDTINWLDVTGIKTKTDTIAWGDVTGIKAKTDTILWTDVTTAKDNVATILTQTNNIAAIKTKTDTINWLDVTGIVTTSGAVKAKTDTIDWTNVAAIKTATDTINWLDVTGVKAKTDTILWTDVTTAKTNVATLIGEIGTGNVAAIKTKTDTINWLDVTGLVTTASTIQAKTDTINWANVSAIKTATDTIAWGDVTGIKAKTDTILWTDVTTAKNNVATILTQTGDIAAVKTKTDTINWLDVTGIVTTSGAIKAKTDTIDWTNVAAIKTATDTIAWGDVTGIKAKTDTILWTDVTTAKNNVATILTQTGDIAAVKTKTDTINWLDVTGIVTTSGAIKAKTDTIDWTNVAAIKTKTDTISWLDVTGIKAKTDTIDWTDVTTAKTNVATLIGEIGVGNVAAIKTKTDTINWLDVTGIVTTTGAVKAKTDTIDWTNVTAIKTATDTINWLDVTGIKAKTDTILWTDVTTAKNNIATLITEIGTGNVAAIKTKTDTINWLDVTGIVTTSGAIQAKTDTIDWTNVAAIKTKTDTISWLDVTGIKAKTDTILWTDVTTAKNNIATLITEIGTGNVAAIKTKTDTISWLDVTGIKAKTDTIDWTDVTMAKTNVATLITEIGTGNVAAIKTKTDTINWLDVTGIVTTAAAVKAKTDTIDWTNVTAIKTSTDTINWNDVTGIKLKTDTIDWTDVDTLVSEVGVGNIAAIKTKTQDINWLDVTGIVTTSGAIKAKTDTIDWTQVAAIKTKTDTIDWSAVTGIKLKTDTINWADVTNMRSDLTNLAYQIGTPNDPSYSNTIFGRVKLVQEKWGTKTAEELYGQTMGAYQVVNQLQTKIGAASTAGGGTMFEDLRLIKDFVNQVGTQITAVDSEFDTQVAALTTQVTAVGTNVGTQVATVGTDVGGLSSQVITGLNYRIGELIRSGTMAGGQTVSPEMIAALTYKVDMLLRGMASVNSSVTTIDTDLDSLATTVGTVDTTASALATNLTTAKTSIDGIVTKLSSGVAVDPASVDSAISSVKTLIGGSGDAAGSSSVFGKIASMTSNLDSIGSDATNAATQAMNANSNATRAATAAEEARAALSATGTGDTTKASLAALSDKLGTVQSEVTKISSGISTDSLKAGISEAMAKISEFAAAQGLGGVEKLALQPATSGEVKVLQDQVERMKALMETMNTLMRQREAAPVVKTWYESGSVLLKVLIVNPSKELAVTVPVKIPLPKEAKRDSVMDAGDLKIGFNAEKGLYEAYGETTLKPAEEKVLQIRLKDIWRIPDEDISFQKGYAAELVKLLKDNWKYAEAGKKLGETVQNRLDEILSSQNEDLGPAKHIEIYRRNLLTMQEIKKDIAFLEKLAGEGKGPGPGGGEGGTGAGGAGIGGPFPGSSLFGAGGGEGRSERWVEGGTLGVSESLGEAGSAETVTLKVEVKNPSKTESTTLPVKHYMPREILEKDILDRGVLEVLHDLEQGRLYLYKEAVQLDPAALKIFEVVLRDIWRLPEGVLHAISERAQALAKGLEGSSFGEEAKVLSQEIMAGIAELRQKQAKETGIGEHVEVFHQNLLFLEAIKNRIDKLEKVAGLVAVAPGLESKNLVLGKVAYVAAGKGEAGGTGEGGSAANEKGSVALKVVAGSIFAGGAPATTTTWRIIFIIVGFLGVVSFLFFVLWWAQVRSEKKVQVEDI